MNYNYIFFNILLLIIWFNTNAILEYVKIFKLSKLFRLDDFENKQSEDFELDYHRYLLKFHNCFFVRLITCPICLTMWFCIPIIFTEYYIEYPKYVILILFGYYLFKRIHI